MMNTESLLTRYLNVAAYKFVKLDRLEERRRALRETCLQLGLKGTILLSPEGINLFLAGPPEAVGEFLASLRQQPEFSDLEVKESESDEQPFNRMLVRIKKEIIAFGIDGIEPGERTSPKLPAAQLRQWLDEGRPIRLLDVRNDYEVSVGTFVEAIPIGVDHFREFPDAIKQLPESMKEERVVMFCTGGIRCEKAGPLMEQAGFKDVLQLDGGILKYFEDCGGKHYRGDCFVFDHRVAVDPALHETDAVLCFRCQSVLDADDQASPRYVKGESCPYCYRDETQRREETLRERHARLKQIVTPLPGSEPYENWRPINIPARYAGLPLFEALRQMHPHVAETTWQNAFAAGDIIQRGKAMPPDYVVHAGERFKRRFPETIEPDVNAAISILWEDEAIIVVDKPAPLPMHPCGRFNRNTLISILSQLYAPQVLRTIHRLDANTSGLVVLARKRRYAAPLHEQFQQQRVEKVYRVGCYGHPVETEFACTVAVATSPGRDGVRGVDPEGHSAHTDFRVLARKADGTSLLEARPRTGRTNQIRIHLWHLGFPIIGDPIYLPERQLGKQHTVSVDSAPLRLQAAELQFEHPLTGKPCRFAAPQPGWFDA